MEGTTSKREDYLNDDVFFKRSLPNYPRTNMETNHYIIMLYISLHYPCIYTSLLQGRFNR